MSGKNKRCVHCGEELGTEKEKQDNVCASCATALEDDDYFEQMMDKAKAEFEKEERNVS